jgi:hypothetical protein
MTNRQIESLVTEPKGGLCAMITRRADGSLVTLGAGPKSHFGANVIASASIALSSLAAAAQSPSGHYNEQAVLTGTVLVPDGSKPAEGALVELRQQEDTVASTKTDAQGKFHIAAEPGNYQIRIKQNALFGDDVHDATLHAGDQSLSPIRTHLDPYENGQQFVTMGVVVSVVKYSPSYAFRHPWQYPKYLTRKG